MSDVAPADSGSSDSTSRLSNRIDQIETEYSQIVRVLASPIAKFDSDPSSEQRAERQRQIEQRERFIRRYQLAIKAFLGKMLSDSRAVDQVWDQFLVKCLSGKLGKYDPNIGSFRFYLKRVLRTTCYEFLKQQARQNVGVRLDTAMVSGIEASDQLAEEAFDQKLIEVIFLRAMETIKNIDSLYYITLKVTTEAISKDIKPPGSESLAGILSAESGKTVSKENARQIKSRASKMFANQLIEEVIDLIGTDHLDEVESALIDIGLLKYCHKALAKRRGE